MAVIYEDMIDHRSDMHNLSSCEMTGRCYEQHSLFLFYYGTCTTYNTTGTYNTKQNGHYLQATAT